MKKFLLTLGVACMAFQSYAATRVLYRQNFESVENPVEAGWANYRGLMTVASDDFGKFLEINQNGQNGGSTFLAWGKDIFMKDGESILEHNEYDVHFEFQIANSTCNQYNGEITIFTNQMPAGAKFDEANNSYNPGNQPYRTPWSPAGYWQNYIFDVSQVDDKTIQTESGMDNLAYAIYGGTKVTENTNEETQEVTVSYSIDYSEYKKLEKNVWYQVDLHVNLETREVEYVMQTLDFEVIQSGTYTVPETNVADGSDISMYAEGINVMLARSNTTYDIDNIQVSFESDYDYAGEPVISLKKLGQTEEGELDLNARVYRIAIGIDDTLYLIGTDGTQMEIPYDETQDGEYIYETTTSGTLTAWATNGTATSEKVTVAVDCTPVVLPTANVTVSSVKEGFGKTYVLTVDNSNVPLRPTIFIDYEFVSKSGEKIAGEDATSGVKVSVEEEGTLSIVTKAFGYESAKTTEVNDIEFEAGKTWDFAHMSDEEVAAAGFTTWQVLNSSKTSGFDNWTARKRLYYLLEGSNTVNDEGNEVWENVYPFGFVSEDSETNVVEYSIIEGDQDNTQYFDGLGIFDNARNVGYMKHLGVFNNETTNNNNDVTIFNVEGSDFVLANYINNYGGNSNHPVCATNEEYYAQLAGEDVVLNAKKIVVPADAELPNLKKEGKSYALENEDGTYNIHYALYRIDTVLTKLVIFKAKNEGGAVEAVESVVAGDNNWYSIDGVRVAEPTRPGLYIHNGKKIIVK